MRMLEILFTKYKPNNAFFLLPFIISLINSFSTNIEDLILTQPLKFIQKIQTFFNPIIKKKKNSGHIKLNYFSKISFISPKTGIA